MKASITDEIKTQTTDKIFMNVYGLFMQVYDRQLNTTDFIKKTHEFFSYGAFNAMVKIFFYWPWLIMDHIPQAAKHQCFI